MTNRTKIQRILPAALLFAMLLNVDCQAQSLSLSPSPSQYRLHIQSPDRDSSFLVDTVGVQPTFNSRAECIAYVSQLPTYLRSKGYVTSSIDSVRFDSSFASIVIYLGKPYTWANVDIRSVDQSLLQSVGWSERQFPGKPMDFATMKNLQNRLLNHLENTGYPFAKIYLDSLELENEGVNAILKVDKGPLYHIDSIRVYGDVKVSNYFLQHYLGIPDGSVYNKEKLLQISSKIRELGYVEEQKPSDLTLLGTGSVLNLYLKPRRASQVNVLIGFLPNNDQLASKKLLITGEANLHLRNALGSGETIGLNWQKLQVESQRLNIIYQHPFIFRTSLGLDFAFDMLKKDSSYLNLNYQFGARFLISTEQSAKLFLHNYQSIVSQGGIDTAEIISTKSLPDIADVRSTNLGLEYDITHTNYKLNPRKGYEARINVSTGIKKIKKNNDIVNLKDPGDPSFDFESLYDTVKLRSYQFRWVGYGANYFPIGKQGTLRAAINGGVFLSDNIFRNELFQIGGYKLLRGFDEESQNVSQYAIGTLEYRYLFGNSYFFVFTDGGWARNASKNSEYSHTYIGTGLGLTLETRNSLFTIAWAIGQRDDIPFNLRQSKIHFGFMNFF